MDTSMFLQVVDMFIIAGGQVPEASGCVPVAVRYGYDQLAGGYVRIAGVYIYCSSWWIGS